MSQLAPPGPRHTQSSCTEDWRFGTVVHAMDRAADALDPLAAARALHLEFDDEHGVLASWDLDEEAGWCTQVLEDPASLPHHHPVSDRQPPAGG